MFQKGMYQKECGYREVFRFTRDVIQTDRFHRNLSEGVNVSESHWRNADSACNVLVIAAGRIASYSYTRTRARTRAYGRVFARVLATPATTP